MQNNSRAVVVLGTGGTIAGTAARREDNVGYTAGQLGVQALVAALPALAGWRVEAEQVAQIDSKDIDHHLWQVLARRLAHHLARDEVGGVIVTHGTDTLEETAWFLQRVLAPSRPVVLTAAMRPATALLVDGPQNLADALAVATGGEGARGVLAVMAGAVMGAADVAKRHGWRLDAFDAGDAGPLARIEQGRLRRFRDWPAEGLLGAHQALHSDPAGWPWVEVVASHGGAGGAAVRALVAAGVQGLVVAGTGHGTLHRELAAALHEAAAGGVAVRLASRCNAGPVFGHDGFADHGSLGPWKSRVELMLELLARR